MPLPDLGRIGQAFAFFWFKCLHWLKSSLSFISALCACGPSVHASACGTCDSAHAHSHVCIQQTRLHGLRKPLESTFALHYTEDKACKMVFAVRFKRCMHVCRKRSTSGALRIAAQLAPAQAEPRCRPPRTRSRALRSRLQLCRLRSKYARYIAFVRMHRRTA